MLPSYKFNYCLTNSQILKTPLFYPFPLHKQSASLTLSIIYQKIYLINRLAFLEPKSFPKEHIVFSNSKIFHSRQFSHFLKLSSQTSLLISLVNPIHTELLILFAYLEFFFSKPFTVCKTKYKTCKSGYTCQVLCCIYHNYLPVAMSIILRDTCAYQHSHNLNCRAK